MASINNGDILKSIDYAKIINYLKSLMIYIILYQRENVLDVGTAAWNLLVLI